MMKEKIMFSVVIPTYNEATKEKEMREHMKHIEDYFKKLGQTYEIIVVLDGPTDGKTPELVKSIAEKMPTMKVIDRKENRGKFYSIREGMEVAEGQIKLFTDMDEATPIGMLDRFIPELQNGADIVIGSRDLSDSEVKIHQPKWKEVLGDTGNYLVQALTGLWGIKDTQCGFKAFTEEAASNVFSRMVTDRWADFEMLMIAKKMDYKIKEVPVEWFDKGASLFTLSGYISAFLDLFKVRWNLIRGVYKIDERRDGEGK